MPDPIDELNTFDPGVPMSPLPATEIRRRGDRRRRRTAAFAVGGAVAAVLLVAVPVGIVAGDDDRADPQPAARVLSDDDALTAEELPARPGLGAWQEIPAEEQVFACAPSLPAALDADETVRHDFGAWSRNFGGGELPSSVIKTAVLQFPSEEIARREYDQAQGWLFGCPGGDDLARKGVSVTSLDVEDGQGEWRLHEFYNRSCGECDGIYFDRMGVVQWGDRIVLVSLNEAGGPLEPEGLDASMDQLVQAAVIKAGGELHSMGGSDRSSEVTPPPLKIDAGLPTADDNEIQRRGPSADAPGAGEVSPCGVEVWPQRGIDRLAVSQVGLEGEYGEARELVELASADEAVALMGDVRSAVSACPTEINELDPTNSPEIVWEALAADTGYEDSVTLAQTYADGLPGGSVWQFTRVGKAILVVSTGGEITAGRSVSMAVHHLTEATREITPAMCRYTDEGC